MSEHKELSCGRENCKAAIARNPRNASDNFASCGLKSCKEQSNEIHKNLDVTKLFQHCNPNNCSFFWDIDPEHHKLPEAALLLSDKAGDTESDTEFDIEESKSVIIESTDSKHKIFTFPECEISQCPKKALDVKQTDRGKVREELEVGVCGGPHCCASLPSNVNLVDYGLVCDLADKDCHNKETREEVRNKIYYCVSPTVYEKFPVYDEDSKRFCYYGDLESVVKSRRRIETCPDKQCCEKLSRLETESPLKPTETKNKSPKEPVITPSKHQVKDKLSALFRSKKSETKFRSSEDHTTSSRYPSKQSFVSGAILKELKHKTQVEVALPSAPSTKIEQERITRSPFEDSPVSSNRTRGSLVFLTRNTLTTVDDFPEVTDYLRDKLPTLSQKNQERVKQKEIFLSESEERLGKKSKSEMAKGKSVTHAQEPRTAKDEVDSAITIKHDVRNIESKEEITASRVGEPESAQRVERIMKEEKNGNESQLAVVTKENVRFNPTIPEKSDLVILKQPGKTPHPYKGGLYVSENNLCDSMPKLAYHKCLSCSKKIQDTDETTEFPNDKCDRKICTNTKCHMKHLYNCSLSEKSIDYPHPDEFSGEYYESTYTNDEAASYPIIDSRAKIPTIEPSCCAPMEQKQQGANFKGDFHQERSHESRKIGDEEPSKRVESSERDDPCKPATCDKLNTGSTRGHCETRTCDKLNIGGSKKWKGCCSDRLCPINDPTSSTYNFLLKIRMCCNTRGCQLAAKICDIYEPLVKIDSNFENLGDPQYHYLSTDAFTEVAPPPIKTEPRLSTPPGLEKTPEVQETSEPSDVESLPEETPQETQEPINRTIEETISEESVTSNYVYTDETPENEETKSEEKPEKPEEPEIERRPSGVSWREHEIKSVASSISQEQLKLISKATAEANKFRKTVNKQDSIFGDIVKQASNENRKGSKESNELSNTTLGSELRKRSQIDNLHIPEKIPKQKWAKFKRKKKDIPKEELATKWSLAEDHEKRKVGKTPVAEKDQELNNMLDKI